MWPLLVGNLPSAGNETRDMRKHNILFNRIYGRPASLEHELYERRDFCFLHNSIPGAWRYSVNTS